MRVSIVAPAQLAKTYRLSTGDGVLDAPIVCQTLRRWVTSAMCTVSFGVLEAVLPRRTHRHTTHMLLLARLCIVLTLALLMLAQLKGIVTRRLAYRRTSGRTT